MAKRLFSTSHWRYLFLITICLTSLALPTTSLSAEQVTYDYDALNRLIKVTYENGTMITYNYDETGNRLQKSVSKKCEGDFDCDSDVDGSDLAVFATDFGRTDCTDDCEGDFDGDGDVDGSDLAVFAADFGRTDCPPCQ